MTGGTQNSIISGMHPVLFTFPEWLPLLGGHHIYAYGVMLGLAFVSGWWLGVRLSLREGLSYRLVNNAYLVVVICSLVGARVAHLISNPHSWRFSTGFFPALFSSRWEGLVAYGGYIGGILGAWAYLRLKNSDIWSLLDTTTPSMVLGLGITRIGCFLAGCCHGKPSDLPWAVVFPPGSQASHNFPAPGGGLVPSVPVHPTQLYESLLGFSLFPLALYLHRRRKFTGQSFLIMVVCYAVARFLLEFIRGDDDRGGLGVHAAPWLSTSQIIGLVLIPLAVVLYRYRRKHVGPPPEPLSDEQVAARLAEAGGRRRVSSGKP